MFLVLALILSFRAFLCDANVITTSSPVWALPENDADINSVNALKENLRRNNDDYKEKSSNIPSHASISTHSKVADKPFHKMAVVNNLDAAGNRRVYNDMTVTNIKPARATLLEDYYRTLTDDPPRKDFSSEKRGLDLKYKDIISSRYPKYVNKERVEKQEDGNKTEIEMDKERVDKLKMFLVKYKGLVNDFISSKDRVDLDGVGRTEPMSAAGSGAGGIWPKAGAAGTGGAVLRAQDSGAEEKRQLVRLPSMHQLDMGPAKGSKVHQLRTHNRLCQRNVMVPEGPKYDSKGHMYLGAYQPARNQDFPFTKPATLILPRCCNCCHKSVLGCE